MSRLPAWSELDLWLQRSLLLGLGGVAVAAGLFLGPTGCCNCPDVEPFEPGMFEIIDGGERPDLEGGLIAASGDAVEVSYSLPDGSDWVVTYEVSVRYPDE